MTCSVRAKIISSDVQIVSGTVRVTVYLPCVTGRIHARGTKVVARRAGGDDGDENNQRQHGWHLLEKGRAWERCCRGCSEQQAGHQHSYERNTRQANGTELFQSESFRGIESFRGAEKLPRQRLTFVRSKRFDGARVPSGSVTRPAENGFPQSVRGRVFEVSEGTYCVVYDILSRWCSSLLAQLQSQRRRKTSTALHWACPRFLSR
jgi:hypothetical protein